MAAPPQQQARPTPIAIYSLLLGVAATILAIDQITKALALEALADGPVDVVDGVLTLRLTFNTGGAFGLLQGLPFLFLTASLLVVAGILIWAHRIERRSWAVPLGLILGGGLGNLYDRIFRDTPGVVDFVDLHVWPVFNVADSAIVTGVVLMLLIGVRSGHEPDEP